MWMWGGHVEMDLWFFFDDDMGFGVLSLSGSDSNKMEASGNLLCMPLRLQFKLLFPP